MLPDFGQETSCCGKSIVCFLWAHENADFPTHCSVSAQKTMQNAKCSTVYLHFTLNFAAHCSFYLQNQPELLSRNKRFASCSRVTVRNGRRCFSSPLFVSPSSLSREKTGLQMRSETLRARLIAL
jgi:hypothetical protein